MVTNTMQLVPPPVHSVQPVKMALICPIAFGDGASKNYIVGTVPAGAVVLGGMVVVTTAFNWGTNNFLDVGTATTTDDFGTDLALGTVGNIVFDDMATVLAPYFAVDTIIYAVMQCTGNQATTGAGYVIVEYVERNNTGNR